MIPAQGSSRRVVLGALPLAAASALVGCSWTRAAREHTATPAAATADDLLRGAALRSEHALLVAYDRAIAAYPSIAATLRAVRAHHAEHVSRLVPATPATAATPATTPATTATAATGAAQASVAGLLTLERAAATALRTQCLAASASLAPLLASIHAAETAHADLLAPLVG
ncbi:MULTISPECIES: hypothetical protein [unclassified Frankia]|uniref:hypothetical protein n=1 Tax=unclassified Frankia TaxID=2632575 RepID=UPI002AD57898|nr:MULTISPECIES: hypothetical protein [unclassified Frankia]